MQVPLAGRKYRVTVERLKRYVDDLRRRGRGDDDQQLLHYAAGRERLAMLRRRGRPPAEGGRRRQPDRRRDPPGRPQRRGPGLLRRGVAGPWTPPALVARLFADPARLARAARGILTDEEQALLRWPAPPRSVRTARWTPADAVLVDEVAGLLERTPGYGHVVRRRGAGPLARCSAVRSPAGWPPDR